MVGAEAREKGITRTQAPNQANTSQVHVQETYSPREQSLEKKQGCKKYRHYISICMIFIISVGQYWILLYCTLKYCEIHLSIQYKLLVLVLNVFLIRF